MAKKRKPGRAAASAGISPEATVWRRPGDPNADRHAEMIVAGMRALREDDVEAAKTTFRAILDQNMEHPEALFGMGQVARRMGQHLTGAELMRRAIGIWPNPVYWSDLGGVLHEMGEYEASLNAQKEAFRLNSRHPGIVQNYASALNHLDRYYEAMPLFRKLARMYPDNQEHQFNYATVLTRIGEYAAANKAFLQAQEIDSGDGTCNFHHGVNLMAMGQWEKAWRMYEWRFLAPSYQTSVRRFSVSKDLPEDLGGESIFLYGEQGVGDEIRFAGMVNEVIERGAMVTLECRKKLLPLFERSFPKARVVEARWKPAEDKEERFDRYLPTGSLGGFLRPSADSFPRRAGFLTPDDAKVTMMRGWLDSLGPGMKIGICWRSSLAGHLRSTAYAEIDDLEPLFRMKDVELINLQYDDAGEELARARNKFGAQVHVRDDLDLFDDLDGAAALTAGLDFVVSANTSVACMAGALGVPGAEFRARPLHKGGLLDGCDPWFPTIRMFGKSPAAPWSGTFREIARHIDRRRSAG